MTRYIALVGGPSTGKSSLIQALEKKGYPVLPEMARRVILEQRASGGKLLPSEDRDGFQQEVLRKQILQRQETYGKPLVFCDTSIACGIAYYLADQRAVPDAVWEAAREHWYDLVLFLDFPATYEFDGLRIETVEKARIIHAALKEVHQHLGHQIIVVPPVSVSERVAFVEQLIKEMIANEA